MITGLMRSALLIAVLVGCGTTHVMIEVKGDPLERIASRAKGEYSIERIGDQAIRLTNTWPWNSVFTLGWSRFRADLTYVDGLLYGQFYQQNNSLLGLLFFTQRIDADEERYYGGALTGWVREEMYDILSWSGADLSPGAPRDIWHGSHVDIDEMRARLENAPHP